MSKLTKFIATIALAGWLAACGGAYAEAIARGDKYADAGQFDEAAAAYEEAAKLDPEDPEAKIKLKDVRRKQASERLQRAAALEQRGELANALVLVQEAARFDPESTDAQRALTRVTGKVLDEAQQLFDSGKLREAFELTTLVLRGAKNHPRARELDDRVRGALAEQSFKAAQALLEKEKLGNALVELAACLTYRPDFPDAKLNFGQVKLRLQEQLRYTVVLESFQGAGTNAALTRALNPELLQQSIDERLLLKVVAAAPKGDDIQGVVVRGEFADYGFNHDKKSIHRSCDYVCGTTYKPNPRIQELRQQLAQLDQSVSNADNDISRKEKDMLEAEKELSREEGDAQKKQAEVDEARARHDDCRAKAPPGQSSPCSSEESNLRSKQSYLDSARRNVDSKRARVDGLRDEVARTKSQRDTSRTQRDGKNQELLKEPEQIAVDKYCPHEYAVEQHAVAAKVTLKLTVQEIVGDKPIVSGQPFSYASNAADESFPAQAGRCPEIAGGDALTLPSENDLKKDLTTKVVKDLRSKVLASYDAYRRGFLASARRDESSGLTEQAIESYVRYVLTGPHALDDKKQLGAFFKKTKGIGKLDALWTN